MSLISRLGVVLGLDAGEFNKNLGIAQSRLQGFSQNIISSRLGLAAIATGFAVAATSAVRFADGINDVAQASELSVQTVLRLNEALVTNGGKADAASQMVTKFSRSVYEANHQNEDMQKAFQKLGISMEDLRTKSMEQLLSKGLKGFKELRDVTERTGIAFDVFGRSAKGVDLGGAASTFESNKNSYKDAQKAFEAIGNALDNIQKISDTIKTSFAIQVGGAFEYITDKAIQFYNTMAKIKNFLNENLGAFAKFVPGAAYMPNQEISLKPKSDKGAEEEINREQEVNKEILKRMKMQEEFYKKEIQISEAKRQRNQKEAELVFLTENERKLQLDIFDIEQKRKLLILENKMNKEQAAEWAQSEKKRAQEEYNTAESQRSFEYGWKKAFATYADNATNAAKLGEQAFVSVTSNMEQALDQFVSTGKLKFGDLAKSIIADLIKIQMRAQLTSLFKGLGNIFGFGGGGSDMGSGGATAAFGSTAFWGGKANGGDVSNNNSYMVGERGPELFIPQTSGTIIPNNKLGYAMGNQPQVVYNGPYIANMSAIDTQSGLQFLAKNKQGVWAANQSAQRSLPQSR